MARRLRLLGVKFHTRARALGWEEAPGGGVTVRFEQDGRELAVMPTGS